MGVLKASKGFRKHLRGLAGSAGFALTFLAPVLPAMGDPFPICDGGRRITCVIDGDTFWLDGKKIRLSNSEISEPKCAAERRRGEAATLRLTTLLNSGELAIERQGLDRYGRTLAQVWVDGIDVGAVLVVEELARPYEGGRKPWC